MSAAGNVLVWICAALTALPLAPCAFVASGCRGHDEQAAAPAEPQPERSCCTHEEQLPGDPTEPERSPCQGECCELSPFMPVGDKVVVPPAVLFVALPIIDDAQSADRDLSSTIAAPAKLSLNVLHCQWRC